jgi:hypothetical protein
MRRHERILERKSHEVRDKTGHRSKGENKNRDEVLLSTTALAWASLGALLGLFFGAELVGFPMCIASTVIGGIFGATLGRY